MAWLTGYTYRKKITITGQTGAGINYQVKLQIGNASGGDFHLSGHSLNFPNDIRFTGSDGSTQLDYWIEIATSPITVWIEVLADLTTNVDIYCYYGKASDTTTSSGTNTFNLFDDFSSGSSPDTSKWTVYSSGSYPTISGGALTLSAASISSGIESKTAFDNTYAIRARMISGGYTSTIACLVAFGSTGAIFTFDYTGAYGNWPTANMINAFRTASGLGAFSLGHDGSSPHIYDLMRSGSQAIVNSDNTYRGTLTGGPTGVLYAKFSGAGAPTATVFDWVLVRKYVLTEPTFSLASAEEQAGSASFTSSPSVARIWIDSVDKGVNTPNTILELSAGSHNYTLKLTGYQDASGSFSVTSGQTTTVSLVTFAGSAYITSTPSIARIWIDGNDTTANTPATIIGLTATSHTYSLVLSGRDNTTGNFAAIAGQTVNIPVTLLTPANIGALSMTITPRETPCRAGICTVDVSVTWKNTGESLGSFVPSITVGSGTVAPIYTSENLVANAEVVHTFTVSNMTAGLRSICPDPN